jgi:ferredoxin-NADP reductase
VRTPEDALFAKELRHPTAVGSGLDISWIHTRVAPANDPRPAGRLTAQDLVAHGWPADFAPNCYVCGPTGFVEFVADTLVSLGHDPDVIRTERFGPTGG